jgi:RNA polymerase sigma factor (sigma-70 family)
MEAVVTQKLSEQALEDYQWVRKAVNGDQRAYAILMNRYQAPIRHMVLKMVPNKEDAEDLTLEAFGKAFRNLAAYSPNFAFSTWLFRIAVNNCIDFIRKKRLLYCSIDEPSSDDSNAQGYAALLRSNGHDPEERLIRQQQLHLARHLVNRLSHRYRLMIELRYFEELSYDEIAHELNIPLGTVKAQLYRAKEMLYELMRKPGASAHFDTVRRGGVPQRVEEG